MKGRLRAVRDAGVAIALLIAGRRREPERGEPSSEPPPGLERSERETGTAPRAEAAVLTLLALATALALGFIAVYVIEPDTQLLGLCIGGSLGCIAAAMIVAGKGLVPRETAVEPRPELGSPDAQAAAQGAVRQGVEGVSRRRLLLGASGAAGASVAAALAVPVASLGPAVGDRLTESPWRPGRRLVLEEGSAVRADDVEEGSFLTAFPEGADVRELGSPVILVRLPPEELRLPPGREDWVPEGIFAFSKICTHAGCAVSQYRYPLYEGNAGPPALVCPCHFSTFGVARGGEVIFGPASRPLPQLPLAIGPERVLVARGGFSGPVGPSWWSVRRT